MSAAPVVSDAERLRLLHDAVGVYLMAGYQLRGTSGYQAVVGSDPKPVNHVLHLLIAVFTCGLWAIVWLLLALTAPKGSTIHVSVDEQGRAWSMKPGGSWQPIA